MFRLNSQTPDAVKVILQNNAPDYLGLRALYHRFPLSCEEHREELLFRDRPERLWSAIHSRILSLSLLQ
jgi:hypothetical protein